MGRFNNGDLVTREGVIGVTYEVVQGERDRGGMVVIRPAPGKNSHYFVVTESSLTAAPPRQRRDVDQPLRRTEKGLRLRQRQ
jgi:hypothetical protein